MKHPIALLAVLAVLAGCSNSVTTEGLGVLPTEEVAHSISLRDTLVRDDLTLTLTTVVLSDREDLCSAIAAAGGLEAVDDVFAVQVLAATTGDPSSVGSNTSIGRILFDPGPDQDMVGAQVIHRVGGDTLLDARSLSLVELDGVSPGSFGISQTSCSSGDCSYGGSFEVAVEADETDGGEGYTRINGRVSGTFNGASRCAALGT
jgi:hypothetical protein